MARTLIGALMVVAAVNAFAQDLGHQGGSYKIIEPDMLEMMQKKAQEFVDSGKYEVWKKESVERARKAIMEPDPVPMSSLPEHKSRLFDPTIRQEAAIVHPQTGEEIVPAGTEINPLDYVSMDQVLIFIDGRDQKQIDWALKEGSKGRSKIVLIAGPWIDLMKKHNQRLYYDLHGTLTAKFGITGMPATIRQEGRKLRVEEAIRL